MGRSHADGGYFGNCVAKNHLDILIPLLTYVHISYYNNVVIKTLFLSVLLMSFIFYLIKAISYYKLLGKSFKCLKKKLVCKELMNCR